MKARERRHLKENELAHTLANAREFVEQRRRTVTAAVAIIVVVAVALGGLFAVRKRTEDRAHGLLAQGMVVLEAHVTPPVEKKAEGSTPATTTQDEGTYPTQRAKLEAAIPKLKAAADAYPGTRAGITARYHLAGAYAALGRHQEAVQAYDDVITRDSKGLYGRMARLGKADEQARSGQYDAAIATYKELSESKDAEFPVDAVLMQLGRTYAAAGKKDEAQKTFTKLVDEHPGSPFSQEARRQLELLKG